MIETKYEIEFVFDDETPKILAVSIESEENAKAHNFRLCISSKVDGADVIVTFDKVHITANKPEKYSSIELKTSFYKVKAFLRYLFEKRCEDSTEVSQFCYDDAFETMNNYIPPESKKKFTQDIHQDNKEVKNLKNSIREVLSPFFNEKVGCKNSKVTKAVKQLLNADYTSSVKVRLISPTAETARFERRENLKRFCEDLSPDAFLSEHQDLNLKDIYIPRTLQRRGTHADYSLESELAKNSKVNVLIYGSPNSGLTTYLKALTLWVIDHCANSWFLSNIVDGTPKYYPFFIDISVLTVSSFTSARNAGELNDFASYIKIFAKEFVDANSDQSETLDEYIEYLMSLARGERNNKKLCLMVNGVEKLRKENDIEKDFLNKLVGFLDSHSAVSVIATCVTNDEKKLLYETTIDVGKNVSLSMFADTDAERFCERFIDAIVGKRIKKNLLTAEQCQNIDEEIEKDKEKLKALIKDSFGSNNPLLLSHQCAIYHEYGDVIHAASKPTLLRQISARVIKNLIKNEKNARKDGLVIVDDRELKIPLAYLALKYCEKAAVADASSCYVGKIYDYNIEKMFRSAEFKAAYAKYASDNLDYCGKYPEKNEQSINLLVEYLKKFPFLKESNDSLYFISDEWLIYYASYALARGIYKKAEDSDLIPLLPDNLKTLCRGKEGIPAECMEFLKIDRLQLETYIKKQVKSQCENADSDTAEQSKRNWIEIVSNAAILSRENAIDYVDILEDLAADRSPDNRTVREFSVMCILTLLSIRPYFTEELRQKALEVALGDCLYKTQLATINTLIDNTRIEKPLFAKMTIETFVNGFNRSVNNNDAFPEFLWTIGYMIWQCPELELDKEIDDNTIKALNNANESESELDKLSRFTQKIKECKFKAGSKSFAQELACLAGLNHPLWLHNTPEKFSEPKLQLQNGHLK